MRAAILLFALFLSACATPKTAPESFYSGTYAPGAVTIEANSSYRTVTSVYTSEDAAIARKAAYARLLLRAKESGYRYFSIEGENEQTVIGHRFTATGTLFKNAAMDADVYPIDDIKRLMQDLPIRTLRQIAEDRRQRELAAQRAKRKTAAVPAVKSTAPVQAAPSANDPLVIMAPEDITGSIRPEPSTIRQETRGAVPAKPAMMRPSATDRLPDERPSSLRLIPRGVILQ